MNIEAPKTTVKTADTSTAKQSTGANSSVEDSKSFKNELESVKAHDSKINLPKEAEEAAAKDSTLQVVKDQVKTAEGVAVQNLSPQVVKDQIKTKDKKTSDKIKSTDDLDPVDALRSKIAIINDIKSGLNPQVNATISKTDEISSKSDYCKTIKMDNKDITLFLNLVDNQQMIASGQGLNPNSDINTSFTEIKTAAAKQAVPVSSTLMDAINESAATNKPFRVDFGGDVAVIMKVDKDGKLSANFIPGSPAVEAYLKNNIESLRQNFDNQNLPYSELKYSNQQKQQNQKNNNNKENDNE